MDTSNSDINQMDYLSFPHSFPHKQSSTPRIFGRTTSKLGRLATRADSHIKHFRVHDTPMSGLTAKLSSSNRPSIDEGEIYSYENLTASTLTSGQAVTGASGVAENLLAQTDQLSTGEAAKIAATERLDGLKQVIARSNEVLAAATTIFPFTLFRDDMVVDRTKVTITKRTFFFSKEVMSIRVEDILNVKAVVGPFFGSLILAVRVLSSEDHHSINFFWRKDAVHLKHIIQGYIIAQHNGIDCSGQTKEELIETLTELGNDSTKR